MYESVVVMYESVVVIHESVVVMYESVVVMYESVVVMYESVVVMYESVVRCRSLLTSVREFKNGDIRNHISEHHRLTKHNIDWDSAECVRLTAQTTNNDWH